MKKIKKIVSMILTTILVSTSISYANTNSKKHIVNNIFTVETKSSNEDSEFFKANIRYPFLKIKEEYIKSNKDSIKFIKNINKETYTYIIEFKNKIKKESKQYEKDYKEIFSKQSEQYVKYKYEAYSEYEVSYNQKNLISIPITTYEFTGGAHGMTYIKSFNYNLKTGDEMKLKDMFKDDVDYKGIVNNYINLEIEKNKELYFTGKDGFKGISSDQSFYIDEDGIVIYFQLYDIAPYYIGIPKFKMTWKEFGEYLK